MMNVSRETLIKGGDFLTDVMSGISDFMTAIIGNAQMLTVVGVMIAGVIGRLAFKTVKGFIH